MTLLRTTACVVFASGLVAGCRCEAEEEREEERGPSASSVASVASAMGEALEPPPLLELVSEARRRRDAQYRAPSEDELREYGKWVRALARSGWADRLPTKLPPSGFLGKLGDSGAIWVLAEDPRRKRGGGLVALRPSSGRAVFIEAPHTFFDGDTLELALLAFDELDARALLVNTMHRGGHGPKSERARMALSGKSPFDVAHTEDSYFARAHEVLLDLDSSVTTVQLHGFADRTAPGVSVVVSAARTEGDARAFAKAIQEAIEETRVRTYPDQIDVLGATTNVQAVACRKAQAPFISIELSRTLRTRLKNDPTLARRFVRALGSALETPP